MRTVQRFCGRSNSIAALAAAALLVSGDAANANFILSLGNVEALPGGLQAFSIRATNDGVDGTGTMLRGFDLQFRVTAPLPPADQRSSRAFFDVVDDDGDGTPDFADVANVNNLAEFSFVRVGSGRNTQIIGVNPDAFGEPNAYIGGIENFRVQALGATDAAAAGAGALIARIVSPSGSGLSIEGNIAGERGPATQSQLFIIATPGVPEPAALSLLGASAVLCRRGPRK